MPRYPARLSRMIRLTSASLIPASWVVAYSAGKREPFAVREVGPEDDRVDTDR